MRFTLWGASDDLVQTSVDGLDDEFECDGSGWSGDLISAADGRRQEMRVHAAYVEPGVWMVGVSQTRDKMPLPNWVTTIVQSPEASYSVQMDVHCPDGTILVTD